MSPVCVCVCVFHAHLLGCGKCVSSCVLYSSVGGLPRERNRGVELSRDAVFNVFFSSPHHLFFFFFTLQSCVKTSRDTDVALVLALFHFPINKPPPSTLSFQPHHLLTWLPSSGSCGWRGTGQHRLSNGLDYKPPKSGEEKKHRLTEAKSQSESRRAASRSLVTR